MPTLSGQEIALSIGPTPFTVEGRTGEAVTINRTVPAPLIRLREGQNVHTAVTNSLDEDTSIHWHGVLVLFQFDGVPGVSFPGIRPGEEDAESIDFTRTDTDTPDLVNRWAQRRRASLRREVALGKPLGKGRPVSLPVRPTTR